jgi:hypothetical protein
MKPIICIFAAAFVLAEFSACAQVTNFSIFKVTVYHQSSPTPPTVPDFPNAYYYGTQLGSEDASDYVDVYQVTPIDNTNDMEETAYNYFSFNSPYFDTKTNFDATYPPGEYDFYIDHTDYTDTGALIVPDEDLYSTNVEAFTTNCWLAMQAVDPSKTFALAFNSFTPSPDTTTAYTFLDLYDQNGNSPFYAGYLTPSTTTTNIPANTLSYGEVYQVDTYFSSRQDTPDAGFDGALGTVGFDNLTYTTLATIPPWLAIFQSNQDIVLTWPALATNNFELEEANNLQPSANWCQVTQVFTTMCGTNYLTLPICPNNKFFRLASFAQ